MVSKICRFICLQVPQFKFYEEIRKYEKLDCDEDRRKKAREIYDTFIMRELLSNSNLYSKASAEHVQKQLAVKPSQATEVRTTAVKIRLFLDKIIKTQAKKTLKNFKTHGKFCFKTQGFTYLNL